MAFVIAATAVFVGLTLWAETAGSRMGLAAKPLASTGFVAVAVIGGARDTGFGRFVLVALALSWCGDVFLLGRARRWFLSGLVAFLAAHLAYVAGFLSLGITGDAALIAALVAVPAAAAVARWLRPHLPPPMRVPVAAYIAVISTMVVLGAGAAAANDRRWLLVAAVAFCVSDLAVAADRFVAWRRSPRFWGLPLYYFAQLVFAWQAGM